MRIWARPDHGVIAIDLRLVAGQAQDGYNDTLVKEADRHTVDGAWRCHASVTAQHRDIEIESDSLSITHQL
jgi:hypothetical protein